MFWLVGTVVLITLFYVWYLREYEKYNKSLESIPGPPPLPLFGNVLEVRKSIEVLPAMMKYREKYGGIFKVRAGPIEPKLVFSDAKNLEFVLTNTKFISKSDEYRHFHNWLGTGLLTSTGFKWKTHRKIITPAFHFKILEDFIDVFNSNVDILVDKLRTEAVGKSSFDVYPLVSLCTLDIICETAMGTKVNAQLNSDSDYVRSVKEMGRLVIERITTLKYFDVVFRLSKDFRKEKKYLEVIHSYTEGVIKKRKQELANNGNYLTAPVKDEFGRKKRQAFLDLLLQESINSENPFTDLEIREEVDTFMFEGHDTTSIALSMLMYCLSLNQQAQRKVVEEMETIFGDDKRQPTYQDLQNMKYLDMCIKEALRLYPSVPFYGRQVSEDVEYNGITIVKGTTIVLFAHGIQRDPEVFPEPEQFIPERFDPTNTKGFSPFAYIPFSAGQRNCIGQKFAVLEMKATVSKLIRNFEILPSTPHYEPVLVAETVLKCANGVSLKLVERRN